MTNEQIEEQLLSSLQNFKTAPFLFVGSGLSIRYLNAESWSRLLSKFAIKSYVRYEDEASSDMPTTSSLIANDFVAAWWENPAFEQSRVEYENIIIPNRTKDLPFKMELAKHFLQIDIENKLSTLNENYQQEIALLKAITVDGIITTNYDLMMEKIFPDFPTFIGQEEMLFGKTVGVGEIYKIHGCCTKFSSIVITAEDYQQYESKNPYLASKLLGIFVDHPIVFIGYSLSDKNIQKILEELVKAIGKDNVDRLSERMFFVVRSEEEPYIGPHSIKIGENIITATAIKTNNFIPIYQAMGKVTRQIPARIARLIKEQLYELVTTNEPTNKLLVTSENLENRADIEFVVGVGVANKELGYKCLDLQDIAEDIVFNNKNYDAKEILNNTLPKNIRTNRKVLPIFKYLRAIGITNANEYQIKKSSINEKLMPFIERELLEYQTGVLPSNISNFEEALSGGQNFKTKLGYLSVLACTSRNKDALLQFLQENFASNSSDTDFQRLVALYDRLEYGW